MKKIILFLLLILIANQIIAQTDPVLSIDGVNTTFKSGLSLPYWLKGGQSIGLVTGVKSASILEFTEDNGNLKYSQTISLTTSQTVPMGKVWKIEGLGLGINGTAISGFSNDVLPTIFISPKTYSTPGSYTWKVPPGVTNICVEVWGGGASGSTFGGGGGGGYGYQCFNVIPNTDYNIIVGSGGPSGNPSIQQSYGETSSFGNLISASGGTPSLSTSSAGIGGSSSAIFSIQGNSGLIPNLNGGNGNGGNGGNGGPGGVSNGGYGNSPGGGGGGNPNYNNSQGGGGNGQVKIYW